MEIIHGSAWCDNCQKDFNMVVLLFTGHESVALCVHCVDIVFQKAKLVAVQIKEKQCEEK